MQERPHAGNDSIGASSVGRAGAHAQRCSFSQPTPSVYGAGPAVVSLDNLLRSCACRGPTARKRVAMSSLVIASLVGASTVGATLATAGALLWARAYRAAHAAPFGKGARRG